MSKLKVEYRKLANPTQFKRFLDGNGALANQDMVAEEFDYDWHARKLTFDTHFPRNPLDAISRPGRQLLLIPQQCRQRWPISSFVLLLAHADEVAVPVETRSLIFT